MLFEPERALDDSVTVKNPLQGVACLFATLFIFKLDEGGSETRYWIVITWVRFYVLILDLFLKTCFPSFGLLDVSWVSCRFFVLNNGFIFQFNRVFLCVLIRTIEKNLSWNLDADHGAEQYALIINVGV